MNATILVVDDEPNILQLISLYLLRDGFAVETASSGAEALEKVRLGKPDLVILDLMLPGIDGLEVCRRLRRQGDLPVIMVTARGEDVDRIVGLELGADDYLAKPFNPRELVARVKAVLRRFENRPESPRVLRFEDLQIDLDRREVTSGNGKVELRPREMDLLAALASEPGVVFSRERLLDMAWGPNYEGDSRTVDVHVTWLRERLRGGGVGIQTVWGVGYKLVEAAQLQPRGPRAETPTRGAGQLRGAQRGE